MTMDDPDTNPGRQPRVGESGAPVGSILSIVLAVVAVIVGFVILKQINDDDDGGGANSPNVPATLPSDNTRNGDNGTNTTENGGGSTTTTEAPGPVNRFKGAKVVVANANDQGGTAGDMSEKLGELGFTMGSPTDAGGDEVRLDRTKIYYRAGNNRARAVAETVARSFEGRVAVAELPAEIPTIDGEMDGAVLVMLGVNHATADPQRPGQNATPPGDG